MLVGVNEGVTELLTVVVGVMVGVVVGVVVDFVVVVVVDVSGKTAWEESFGGENHHHPFRQPPRRLSRTFVVRVVSRRFSRRQTTPTEKKRLFESVV